MEPAPCREPLVWRCSCDPPWCAGVPLLALSDAAVDRTICVLSMFWLDLQCRKAGVKLCHPVGDHSVGAAVSGGMEQANRATAGRGGGAKPVVMWEKQGRREAQQAQTQRGELGDATVDGVAVLLLAGMSLSCSCSLHGDFS